MNTLLYGNFPKNAGNQMFVTRGYIPTQERGNEGEIGNR